MIVPSPKQNVKNHKIISNTTAHKNQTVNPIQQMSQTKNVFISKTSIKQKQKVTQNKKEATTHKQIKSLITTMSITKQMKKYNTNFLPSSIAKKNANLFPKKSTNVKSNPNNVIQKKTTTNSTKLPIKTNFHSTLNSGNLANSSKLARMKMNLTKGKKEPKPTSNKQDMISKIKKSSNANIVNNQQMNNSKQKQKGIVTTTNSIEKIIHSSSNKQTKQSEYAKIFGLLNNEIKEITDLFKRTQSVDQQKKLETEHNLRNFTDICKEEVVIDSDIFEKELSQEANGEKKVDVSQLEESKNKNYNNTESILFSSYNSEFYKNLINSYSKEEIIDVVDNSIYSSNSSSNNNKVIQIAQNNINEIQNNNNINDTNNSEKTECQFGDVVFNQREEIHNPNNQNNQNTKNILDDLEKTEKTCNILEENKENDIKQVPIQEIMRQLRGKIDMN